MIMIKSKKPKMNKQKGVFLIELIIAMVVIVTGLIMILNIVGSMSALAAKTRNRVYAEIMARSMLDRIRAHHYGDPEPEVWKNEEILKIIPDIPPKDAVNLSGRPVQGAISFKRDIKYENGSFVGKGSDNYDIVTVTITWHEARAGKKLQGAGVKSNTSQLTFDVEVRRVVPDQEIPKKDDKGNSKEDNKDH